MPKEHLRARKVSRGVTALLVTSDGGSGPMGSPVLALGLYMCLEVSAPASVLFIPTRDRAYEPHALSCRNMRVKIGHLKWCWFFLSSNYTIFSKILLQNFYNQGGNFRGIEFTPLFKLCLFFFCVAFL